MKFCFKSFKLDILWAIPADKWDIKFYNSREISYLQATVYYFVYYINTIALYWQENKTNDLGFGMVNALPFFLSTGWRARQVTCQQLISNNKHM